ncbi:hypothetical protein A0H81_13094 [Grifola frondosa]|uniref:DUF6534 domain-containing protein n=1 Tax=Grifola frondosa TaxID=5627 RepID=A0A1C7LQ72_GRIFR|nr:hypothetical protein A0H81_13094 [Grifola frondosa]
MADLDLDFGAAMGSCLIAVTLSMILYSCTCAQSVYYARNYPEDHWMLKAFVEYMLGTCLVGIGHCFFIHKIWHLLEVKWCRYPLTIAGLVLAVISLGGGVGVTYALATNETWPSTLAAAKIPECIQRTATIMANMYIMLRLGLIFQAPKSEFERTTRLMNKLLFYVANGGIVMLIIQVCGFTIYITTIDKATLVWTIFYVVGNKVFANQVLVVVNARKYLRRTYTPRNGLQIHVFNFVDSHIQSSPLQIS